MTAYNGGVIETDEETVEQNVPMEQVVKQDIRVRKETVGNQATMQDEDDLISDEIKKRMLSSNQTHVRS